jgi:hypothetical protein
MLRLGCKIISLTENIFNMTLWTELNYNIKKECDVHV